MRKRPNFFIVGAPKCGTTALSAYLSAHPNVYFSNPKEPHHFARDLPALQGSFSDPDLYYGLFSDAKPQHMALGEASTFYIYSDEAIAAIRKEIPQARLIIMLRHPVDMVYSFHGEWLFNHNEDQEDFETAWRLQSSRKKGESIPKHLRHPQRLLQYGDIGKFTGYVQRIYDHFPREQVHTIVFDELIADTKSMYDSVLRFLDLPDDGRTQFPRLNASKTSRFPFLTLMTRKPPPLLSRILNKNRRVRNLKYQLIRGIDKLNMKPSRREGISPELRSELQEFFSEDIRKLERLIEKDLSKWINPS